MQSAHQAIDWKPSWVNEALQGYPVIYAFLGGSLVAGVGAAVGTLIGSFILQAAGTGLGPLGSLVSGVPANFIGFYLIGWFVSKFKSWNGFILGTFVSLMIGNLVAAAGVAFYLTYVFPQLGFNGSRSQARYHTGAHTLLDGHHAALHSSLSARSDRCPQQNWLLKQLK